MKLSELVKSGQFFRSVEVFPPKKEENIPKMLAEIQSLKEFDPAFVSVTYGAGGSTQGRSLQVISGLAKDFEVLAHFTCVSSNKDQIDHFMTKLREIGVNNVLALRGDIPSGMSKEEVLSDFEYASELVQYLKQTTKLDIAVAAYPEVHPESPSYKSDQEMLLHKVNQGAQMVITQLFLDNEIFYRFFEQMQNLGLEKPIIPGIMPITSFKSISKIIELSGTRLPNDLYEKLQKYQADDVAVFEIGQEHAINQSEALKSFGVNGVHFYSLNKRRNVEALLKNI
jgi:methylenetetrahydrofolate reductase (NADPH)